MQWLLMVCYVVCDFFGVRLNFFWSWVSVWQGWWMINWEFILEMRKNLYLFSFEVF